MGTQAKFDVEKGLSKINRPFQYNSIFEHKNLSLSVIFNFKVQQWLTSSYSLNCRGVPSASVEYSGTGNRRPYGVTGFRHVLNYSVDSFRHWTSICCCLVSFTERNFKYFAAFSKIKTQQQSRDGPVEMLWIPVVLNTRVGLCGRLPILSIPLSPPPFRPWRAPQLFSVAETCWNPLGNLPILIVKWNWYWDCYRSCHY